MNDLISRQAAIDVLEKIPVREFKKCDDGFLDALISIGQVYMALEKLPSAQSESYLDSIVSEIEKTISETMESGKHHEIHIRTNGTMICFGLQLALEIIEEKRNERSDIQTGND